MEKHMRGNKIRYAAMAVCIAAVAAACWHQREFIQEGIGDRTFEALEERTPESVVFAVIGDYGDGSENAGKVARLVHGWQPDFVVTVGDNSYRDEAVDVIDQHVGQFYSRYIHNYQGEYGPGSSTNRFFPSPGHRDWDFDDLKAYLDYFDLPGNERYYDFKWGPVHIFVLDTDEREPDGADVDSRQAAWLKQQLAGSDKPWKIVVGQHAPYTSHAVEDTVRMRWPFAKWGADAMIFGHYHVYERLLVDGIPHFINGIGGTWISGFGEIDFDSQFRYNRDYGAMAVVADPEKISFGLINTWGRVVDTYQLVQNPEKSLE